MFLTKPAGALIQIISIPFLLYGLFGFLATGKLKLGIIMIFGLALLYLGGRPARRRP